MLWASTRLGAPPVITKCDPAGEVGFAGISTLTGLVFKLVPNVNHVYFRLRQQDQN
jgi:hypothetical protein